MYFFRLPLLKVSRSIYVPDLSPAWICFQTVLSLETILSPLPHRMDDEHIWQLLMLWQEFPTYNHQCECHRQYTNLRQ